MVTEDRIELEKNAPFEEIGKDWYVHLLECVMPKRWCNPYSDGGWFFMGEAHANDCKTGEAYHYLCFRYAGKYYAGCRSIEIKNGDIEHEISKFCRDLSNELTQEQVCANFAHTAEDDKHQISDSTSRKN